MTDHCWYTVDIDIANALNPSFELPIPNLKKNQLWKYPASEIFSSEWLDYTRSVGINFENGFLFHRYELSEPVFAHVDVMHTTKNTYFGFNWVLLGGSDGSRMIWYEIPEEEPTVLWSQVKKPYMVWPISNLTPIEECEIKDKLTLVKIAVPHEIYNITKERWSISARIESFDNVSWDYMVDNLRKQNLLVERDI